jgi:hypothetical protein
MIELTQRDKINLWLEDLRNNPELQGKYALCSGDRYCCLGRACEVAITNGLLVHKKHHRGNVFKYNNETLVLPEEVKNWYGFKSRCGGYAEEIVDLTDKNDEEKLSFSEIADYVENNIDKIFNLE